MFQLSKKEPSSFFYTLPQDTKDKEDFTIHVKISTALHARVVMCVNHKHTISISINADQLKSPSYYVLQCEKKYEDVRAYRAELLSFFEQWAKMLLLLHALDRTNVENEMYLQCVCETMNIPYDHANPKQSEEACVGILLEELAKYSEFSEYKEESKHASHR